MRIGSLFSGIGGIDLGFEQAGHETVFQVEIDVPACAVLARHFPKAERFDDVQTVGRANLPDCDVLVGGFPCQDLSVAGKRKGLAGNRSGLFFEFMRIADELTPAWVLIENVPGLLSSNDGRDMGVVIGTLAELGYGVGWRVLDSQYFGLAQRRRRVFIVGSLGTADGCTLLLEPESSERDSAPSREKRKVAATLFASGAGTSRPAGTASEPDFLVESPVSTLQGHNWRNDVEGSAGGHLLVGSQGSPQSRLRSEEGHLVTMMRWREGKPGGGKGELLSPDQSLTLATANDQVMFHSITENQRGEVWEEEGIPTTVTAGGGKPGQGYPAVRSGPTVRRLTPTECERLQGFPDGYTEGQSDSTRYRQLGNAVSVPVARWIAERLPT